MKRRLSQSIEYTQGPSDVVFGQKRVLPLQAASPSDASCDVNSYLQAVRREALSDRVFYTSRDAGQGAGAKREEAVSAEQAKEPSSTNTEKAPFSQSCPGAEVCIDRGYIDEVMSRLLQAKEPFKHAFQDDRAGVDLDDLNYEEGDEWTTMAGSEISEEEGLEEVISEKEGLEEEISEKEGLEEEISEKEGLEEEISEKEGLEEEISEKEGLEEEGLKEEGLEKEISEKEILEKEISEKEIMEKEEPLVESQEEDLQVNKPNAKLKKGLDSSEKRSKKQSLVSQSEDSLAANEIESRPGETSLVSGSVPQTAAQWRRWVLSSPPPPISWFFSLDQPTVIRLVILYTKWLSVSSPQTLQAWIFATFVRLDQAMDHADLAQLRGLGKKARKVYTASASGSCARDTAMMVLSLVRHYYGQKDMVAVADH